MTTDAGFVTSQLNQVKRVVAIPTYFESDTVQILLRELVKYLTKTDAIFIIDDSPSDIYNITKSNVLNTIGSPQCSLFFLPSSNKSGRGAAIRRGMIAATEMFPQFEFFLECDADGSHQAIDINRVLNSSTKFDLVIGSRYLPKSKIYGWSIERKIFSRMLNILIPNLFKIPVKDVTNGLRRYSRLSVTKIISKVPINLGFTYLTEQAYIVSQHRLPILEVDIEFAERVAGISSVTWKEISNSIKGIINLWFRALRNDFNE
jgi:dolichol-phosphate mannosyltransferase